MEYTFLWYIENYSYCCQKNGEPLTSPYFTADVLESTSWLLRVYPRGKTDKDKGYISLFLSRSPVDDGPNEFPINYELSVLAADGSAFRSVETPYAFAKGGEYGKKDFLEIDEILLRRNADYLPGDILTVRCRMWKGEKNTHSTGQCSARTHIRIEKNSFFHVMENFSTLQDNVIQTINIPSHSKDTCFKCSWFPYVFSRKSLSSGLYFTADLCREKNIMIKIVPSESNLILCKCELYILDVSGNIIECGKTDNRCDAERKSISTLALSLTKEAVLKRKTEYLPNDKLSLLCECTFSAGLEYQAVEETLHQMPLAVLKQKMKHASRNVGQSKNVSKNVGQSNESKNANKVAEKSSTYPSASEDMKALYVNQRLTDVELKTKTKSFPAHKIVLCARSPVFEEIITNNMEEKYNNCIQVDDMGDDIVQQMLLFLYSDSIDYLEWKAATKLYDAAVRYQIGKLKEVCSSFLVENLTVKNAGEILVLADIYDDTDLHEAVEDFILEHEQEVFGSKEWEILMETNPLLAMKAMQLRYDRNQVN